MVAHSITCGHFMYRLPAELVMFTSTGWLGDSRAFRMYAYIAHEFCEPDSSHQIKSPQSHWPLALLKADWLPGLDLELMQVWGTFYLVKEHSVHGSTLSNFHSSGSSCHPTYTS